jgi:PAS domain S-box-containing protein
MGANVLVVEDEGIVGASLRRTLQEMGHTVIAVTGSGEEAVRIAREIPPDIVLMDIRLSGPVDGIDAARRILSRHDVPVIFTTAYADEATLARAKLTSTLAYLTKPIDDQQLRIAVDFALYRHRMERELLRRVELEAFLADANGKLLTIGPENRRSVLSWLLERAAAFAEADRSLVHLYADEEGVGAETLEYHRAGLLAIAADYDGLSRGSLPWVRARAEEGEPICVRNTDDLPEEAAPERSLWAKEEIRSILLSPLLSQGRPFGWMALGAVGEGREWSAREIRLLRMLADTLASALTRVKAQEEVIESEEKFRTLVENLSEIIFSLDAKGYIEFIGPGIEPLTGYVPEDVVGEHFTRFVHPHDRDALVADWERTMGGRIATFDFRILTQAGDVRWVRTSSRPVFTGSELAGMTGIMLDLTHEREAQESLGESEDRYRKLWEVSSDGLVLIDGESGQILECNHEFEEQSGRTAEDLKALKIWEIRPASLRAAAREKFFSILAAGAGGSSELCFERPDGSLIDVEFASGVVSFGGRRFIQSRCRKIRR